MGMGAVEAKETVRKGMRERERERERERQRHGVGPCRLTSYVCWVAELSPEVVVSWEGLLAELCSWKYMYIYMYRKQRIWKIYKNYVYFRYYARMHWRLFHAHLGRFCFRSAHHHHHKAVLLNLVVTQRLCIIQDLPCKIKRTPSSRRKPSQRYTYTTHYARATKVPSLQTLGVTY